MTQSTLSEYLEFTKHTESDKRFHRWCFLSCVAAKLGRRVYFPFGHGRIYPNMYVLLVGVPAARKSTAVKIAKQLMAASEYRTFSFTRTSREKFLLDFEEGFEVAKLFDKTAEANVLAALSKPLDLMALLDIPYEDPDPVRECFICCDEFTDFIGQKNIGFVTTLTTLWDNLDNYPERLKNSKSVNILKPTVSLLGGLTPDGMNTAMPPEVIGSGFMSRVILVHGDPPRKKITFPVEPDPKINASLVQRLKSIAKIHGEAKLTPHATELIDEIYQSYHNLPDARLQYYCARRLDHLLKLCMVIGALKDTTILNDATVVEANTILTYTEQTMAKALGEFGEAKNSKAAQKIMEVLQQNELPVRIEAMWQAVSTDIDRYHGMIEILHNLQIAGKVILSSDAVMLNKAPAPKNVVGLDFERYIQEMKLEL